MGFSLDISRFTDKVKGREDLVLRKVALDIHRGVVQKTPVDTGRARSNWNVGIEQIDSSVDEGARKKASELQAEAQRILESAKVGQAVFVTNNVDYINLLEQGKPGPGSKRAPNGMVAVTLRNYPGIVEDSVQNAKRRRP